MKSHRLFYLVAVLVSLTSFPTTPAKAQAYTVGYEINAVHDFYAPLGQHGYWVDVAQYGRCWYPAYVSSDWRPYSDGHWLWTDGGWYWVSEEPWAWATYHYGRWVWHSYYGWLWVPDVEWGPSWVAWREGSGYIGWAPLPPRCHFGSTGYIVFEEHWVSPSWYVYVNHRNFCHRITPTVIIVDKTLCHKTVNCTQIRRERHGVVNNGPRLEAVQTAAGRRIPVSTVNDLRRGALPPELKTSRPEPSTTRTVRLPTAEPVPEPRTDSPRRAEIPVVRGGGVDYRQLIQSSQPNALKESIDNFDSRPPTPGPVSLPERTRNDPRMNRNAEHEALEQRVRAAQAQAAAPPPSQPAPPSAPAPQPTTQPEPKPSPKQQSPSSDRGSSSRAEDVRKQIEDWKSGRGGGRKN